MDLICPCFNGLQEYCFDAQTHLLTPERIVRIHTYADLGGIAVHYWTALKKSYPAGAWPDWQTIFSELFNIRQQLLLGRRSMKIKDALSQNNPMLDLSLPKKISVVFQTLFYGGVSWIGKKLS